MVSLVLPQSPRTITLATAVVFESIIGPRIDAFLIAALSALVGRTPPFQLAAVRHKRSPLPFVQSLSAAETLTVKESETKQVSQASKNTFLFISKSPENV
jgi:hypothetical protein